MKLKHACKKGVTLVLAGLMAAATLTACGSGSESTATAGAESVTTETSTSSEATESTAVTESDETLVMILETEPKTLTNLNNASTLQVFPEAIGDSLLRYNDETKTADPCLAESYEMIDDTHYRFHLREDAVYSDGTPVTADDVLYSLTQYKEVGVQDALMIDPANCVVEDEHTFVLALETYKLGWEFCVAQGTTAIYSEAAVEAAGGVDAAGFAPVGCGTEFQSPPKRLLLTYIRRMASRGGTSILNSYRVFIGGAPPNDKIYTKNPKYAEQYRYTIKQERKNKKPWAVSGSVLIIYAFGAHGKSFP